MAKFGESVKGWLGGIFSPNIPDVDTASDDDNKDQKTDYTTVIVAVFSVIAIAGAVYYATSLLKSKT